MISISFIDATRIELFKTAIMSYWWTWSKPFVLYAYRLDWLKNVILAEKVLTNQIKSISDPLQIIFKVFLKLYIKW